MISATHFIVDARVQRRPGRSWLRLRVLTACVGAALALGSPASVRAADTSDEDADARLRGYTTEQVILPKSGVGTTWMAYIVLAAIGSSVLFKNANRSHMD